MIVRFKQRPDMVVNLNFPDWLDKENRPTRKTLLHLPGQAHPRALEEGNLPHIWRRYLKIPSHWSDASAHPLPTPLVVVSAVAFGIPVRCSVSLLCVGILRSSHTDQTSTSRPILVALV